MILEEYLDSYVGRRYLFPTKLMISGKWGFNGKTSVIKAFCIVLWKNWVKLKIRDYSTYENVDNVYDVQQHQQKHANMARLRAFFRNVGFRKLVFTIFVKLTSRDSTILCWYDITTCCRNHHDSLAFLFSRPRWVAQSTRHPPKFSMPMMRHASTVTSKSFPSLKFTK